MIINSAVISSETILPSLYALALIVVVASIGIGATYGDLFLVGDVLSVVKKISAPSTAQDNIACCASAYSPAIGLITSGSPVVLTSGATLFLIKQPPR